MRLWRLAVLLALQARQKGSPPGGSTMLAGHKGDPTKSEDSTSAIWACIRAFNLVRGQMHL